jgi:hypothetical protein
VDGAATRGRGAKKVDHQPIDNQLSDDERLESLPPLRAEFGVTALAGQVLRLNGRPLERITLTHKVMIWIPMTANDRLDTRLPIGFATHPCQVQREER